MSVPMGIDDPTYRHAAAMVGVNTLSSGGAPDSQNFSPEQYDAYIKKLTEMWAASAGLERDKLDAQIDNAYKGRENAIQLAKITAKTSKYGVDAQSATALRALQENARQYDSNHALDMQKLGLDYAKTATDYLSTPDRYIQAGNYINMAGRALGGQAPQYGANVGGTPTPKTQADFAVLAGYPAPASASASGASGASTDSGATTTNSTNTPQVQQDPRINAVTSMIKALPPSGDLGLNGNDYAVLQAAHALYSSSNNLAPGTVKRMSPDNLALNRSAGARLGYSVPEWEYQMRQMDPGQGAAGLA